MKLLTEAGHGSRSSNHSFIMPGAGGDGSLLRKYRGAFRAGAGGGVPGDRFTSGHHGAPGAATTGSN